MESTRGWHGQRRLRVRESCPQGRRGTCHSSSPSFVRAGSQNAKRRIRGGWKEACHRGTISPREFWPQRALEAPPSAIPTGPDGRRLSLQDQYASSAAAKTKDETLLRG